MIDLDRNAIDTIKSIYSQFESNQEISISSPEYKKTVIDYLVKHGLLDKMDISTLSGWAYIIKPTYEGELLASDIFNLKSSKVEEFIKQGEMIMKEEYHKVTEPGILMSDYIDGPKSDQWFNEISIFNSRYLKEHPLHDQIDKVCKNHNYSFSAHKEMMGFLHALQADNELDADIKPQLEIMSAVVEKRINQEESVMKKKYQIFISSTYNDLVEERAAVSQCLLDCGCIPVGMEQFPASGMSQMEYIKKMLRDCDYYILILAGRYGSKDTDGIGFTEKEYDYAIETKLPVMSFVIEDMGKLQAEKCEATDEGRASLNAFREKVCKSKLVKMYKNADDLKASVAVSLMKCIQDFPAIGWVRATEFDSNDAVTKQVKAYLENITNLQSTRVKVEPNEDGGNTLIIN